MAICCGDAREVRDSCALGHHTDLPRETGELCRRRVYLLSPVSALVLIPVRRSQNHPTTTEGTPEMTITEAYQQMREYFSRPEARLAKKDGGGCEYRTDDNRKCAVGCLIPDNLYAPQIEGLWAEELLRSEYTVDPMEWGEDESHDDNLTKRAEAARAIRSYLDLDDQAYTFVESAQQIHDYTASNVDDFVLLLAELYRESTLA